MQCSCGGATAPRVHSKALKGVVIGTLEYERCTGCGRTSDFVRKALNKGVLREVERGKPGTIQWK